MRIEDTIGDYQAFFSDLLARLAGLSIEVKGMPISHVCYRVATQRECEVFREQVKMFCKAYTEYEFNGRSISLLLLEEPLALSLGYSAPLIELPAPKSSHPYPTGLEHVGFVVGEQFSEFHKRYLPVLTGQKDWGPYCQPLYVAFDNGTTVKFYERSLEEVVKLEGKRFTSA